MPPPQQAAPTLPSAGTVGREAIDPASRGERLTFDAQIPALDIPQIGGFDPARDVVAGTAATPMGLDFSQFGLNPADFAQGGRFDFGLSGGGGGGFTVNPQSVMENALSAFNSQLPSADLRLRDATEGLAKSTSALGRTGSGLFNRDTDTLTERERAARESLLGNLSFQAATTDAGNDLQAQIATGGFNQQAADRSLRGRTSGASNALQAALEGAGLNLSGQQFDINNQINNDQFNIQNALNAAINNQGADLTTRGQDINVAGQNADRSMQGQQYNINNALNVALEQLGLSERQQGREDRLASEANNDLFRQLALLQSGFGGDPAQVLAQLAGTQGAVGQEYGANAGQTRQQAGGMGAAISQFLSGLVGGGGGNGAPNNSDGYYNVYA